MIAIIVIDLSSGPCKKESSMKAMAVQLPTPRFRTGTGKEQLSTSCCNNP